MLPYQVKLGDGCQVGHKSMLLDDKMALGGHFNEAEIAKTLHEDADTRPGGADHGGQFFVRDSQLNADAARVFYAKFSG